MSSNPKDHWLDNYWSEKRDDFLSKNMSPDELECTQNLKRPILYEDNLAWAVYKVDKLDHTWKWDVPDEYWMSNNSWARPMLLAVCASLFEQRKQIENPICISVYDSYWVHPGTHRYFLNRVCNDFDLPALIIDTSGKYNYQRILNDFKGVEPYEESLDITYVHRGNIYVIKPARVLADESHYKLEYNNVVKIFNLDYAIDIWYNDNHYMTVQNNKPKKSFRVSGIEGIAQLAIHLLCDPNYSFGKMYYESI